jgi:hypothetical protein
MATHTSTSHRGATRSRPAPFGLRKLAAGLGIAVIALLHTTAAPARTVPTSGPVRFLDRGGPVLTAAQTHLLYWGSAWRNIGISVPTPNEITAAFRTVLTGPYLSGLAQYRHIRPAVLAGSTMVATSDPPSRFRDDDVAAFLDAQLDTGVMPGPDAGNQALYIVVIPVGVSAGGDSADFAGEHYYYERHGQRIHFAWTANSGSLAGATRTMSHELVESVTDPESSAIVGVSRACEQGGWCEIADICSGTGLVNGVTVWPYWSERAGSCVAPDRASTIGQPARRAPRAASTSRVCPTSPGRVTTHRPIDWCA